MFIDFIIQSMIIQTPEIEIIADCKNIGLFSLKMNIAIFCKWQNWWFFIWNKAKPEMSERLALRKLDFEILRGKK
jgi:hypothetical protein